MIAALDFMGIYFQSKPTTTPIVVVVYICDAIQVNQSEVKHVTFSVFYLIAIPIIRRGTPPEFGLWFHSYSNSEILKTIENKRNPFLSDVSHNQCSRLLTDPARSQHNICHNQAYGTSQYHNSKTKTNKQNKELKL